MGLQLIRLCLAATFKKIFIGFICFGGYLKYVLSPSSLIFNLIISLLKVKALRENTRHRNYGTTANPFPAQNQTIPKCYSYSMFKSIFFCFSLCEHFIEMVELIRGEK